MPKSNPGSGIFDTIDFHHGLVAPFSQLLAQKHGLFRANAPISYNRIEFQPQQIYGPISSIPSRVYGPPTPVHAPAQIYGPPNPIPTPAQVYGPPNPIPTPAQIYGPPNSVGSAPFGGGGSFGGGSSNGIFAPSNILPPNQFPPNSFYGPPGQGSFQSQFGSASGECEVFFFGNW